MNPELTGVALGLLLGAAKIGFIGTIAFGIGWWRAHRRLQRLDATLPDPAELQDRLARLEELADYTAGQLHRVVDAQAAGRFRGRGMLTIEITRVRFNGRSYAIHTDQWSKQTDARGKGTAEKVGGGAALGAIIGGIAGGGKGAGIGAAVGAGAGGVTQAAIRAAQIKLGPESLLTFRLAQPATVQPSSSNDRNTDRRRLQ